MTGPASVIEAGGVRWVVEERGSGPVVLFVHGWAASRHFWREVVDRLAGRFRCITPDLPGFGDAEEPAVPACTIDYYARVVCELARRVGAWAVVAHSMGGMIAAQWAAAGPEGLERLVLVNAPVHGPSALTGRSRMLVWPAVRWIVYWLCRARQIRQWVARNFTFRRELPEELLDGILRPTYRVALGSLESMRRMDLRGQLSAIRARTLVVGTDRDGIIRRGQVEMAARAIPGARLMVIQDCGHVPMVERPEQFSRAVEEFLCAAA